MLYAFDLLDLNSKDQTPLPLRTLGTTTARILRWSVA
jgi:hypothetical protein